MTKKSTILLMTVFKKTELININDTSTKVVDK